MKPLVFFSFTHSTFIPFFSFTWEHKFYPFPKRMREKGGDGGFTSKDDTKGVGGKHKRGGRGGSLGFGDGSKCVRVSGMCLSNGKRRKFGGCEQHDNQRCFF